MEKPAKEAEKHRHRWGDVGYGRTENSFEKGTPKIQMILRYSKRTQKRPTDFAAKEVIHDLGKNSFRSEMITEEKQKLLRINMM